MNPILAALVQAGALTTEEANRLNRLMDDVAGRAWAEREIAAAFARGLRIQQGRLRSFLEDEGARISDPALTEWWRQEDRLLYGDVAPSLRNVAQDRATISAVRSGGLDSWLAVNEGVNNWLETYYLSLDAGDFGSIPNLNATARTQAGTLISAWQRGELEAATAQGGLPQLIAAMEDVFGPERATRVAVTEVTRIYAEATRAAALANPTTTLLRWDSVADSLVCPICGPLHGRVIDKRARTFPGGFFPPAHVSCRCNITEETSETARVAVGAGGTALWNYPSA